MKSFLTDLPGSESFCRIELLEKGWSSDAKYRIETTDGERLLLRITDIAERGRKEMEYSMLRRADTLGIPMTRPLRFGLCNGGKSVYQLLSWCEGEDAQSLFPRLTGVEQYLIGLKAGKALKSLHTLPAPEHAEPWSTRFGQKIQGRLFSLPPQSRNLQGLDTILRYLDENKALLEQRPQCFIHGDFNASNLIVTPEGEIGVIDFNAFNLDHGDPWWEFCAVAWGKEAEGCFFTGLIRGYFEGEPPPAFFQMLALYYAYDVLAALCETSQGAEGSPEDGPRHLSNVLRWFDGMRNPVPTWYERDFCLQYIDGVPFGLKAPYDMSFLRAYGTVFKVFDEQDSGNICFGTQKGDERFFVKFAGASTRRYFGTPQEAIARLKACVPIYRELAHPCLVELQDARETGGGYAVAFAWTDALCMGKQYPLSRQASFLALSHEEKLGIYDEILAFHAHAHAKGYVAIDFYDASIMYDPSTRQTILCDIDYYAAKPYINQMGRLWGSTRYMSPEEFTLGAAIDEVTNVYTMGATAFSLFAGADRSAQAWPFGGALYAVAQKAVSEQRSERQQSIRHFISEWKQAKETGLQKE